MQNTDDLENHRPAQNQGSQQEILQTAIALQKKGNLADARQLYREVLDVDPDHFDALHMSAVIARNMKSYAQAEIFYKRALNGKEDFAPLYLNYGLLLGDLRRFAEAATMFEKAVILKADYVDAYYNLGLVLQNLKQLDGAVENFLKVVALKSNYVEAFFRTGIILHEMNRPDAALASYDKAISIKSDHSDAYYNRGVALRSLKRSVEAISSYDEAIAIKPEYTDAYYSRGNALKDLRRYDESLKSYDCAILIKSDHAHAYFMRGVVLQELKSFPEAVMSFQKAIAIKPDYTEAYNFLGYALIELKRLEDGLESYQKAIKIKPDFFIAHSNLLFSLSYADKIPMSSRLKEASLFGASAARAAKVKFSSWKTDHPKKQLRIGFVSGDFWSHPVGYFLKNVVSSFDKSRLDWLAYTNNSYEDSITAELKENFSSYKSLVGMTDFDAAKIIHGDGVHILVDLSGHTALNRLPVFAYKPAPIQISWLGYWATTGVREIDYILGDPNVTPVAEEHDFSERIKRLPECYFCFSPPELDIDVGDLPALRNGYITFGCFNNFSKVNDSVISLWARVLLSIPQSRLYLKASQLDNFRIVQDAIDLFAASGVTANRLVFEGRTDRIEYLKSYNKVDITLDPFPYPGGATSVESLWMGVPVLTKKGNWFIAHNGETIARNSGQSNWIARDEEDYLQKAINLSSDLHALARLRAGLRRQILRSPLFDSERFARNFEQAMVDMWRDYLGQR